MKKFVKVVAAFALAAGLAACGGGGGGDDVLDSALKLSLEGTYSDIDGLAAEFKGTEAMAVEFGSSPFGTNSSVFKVGDAYISDISCGSTSCTAKVAVAHSTAGVLQSTTREDITIQKQGDSLILTGATIGTRELKPKTAGSSGGTGGAGGATTLAQTATCAQWWAALTAGSGSWKFTYYRDIWADYTSDAVDWTITFSGDQTWSVTDASPGPFPPLSVSPPNGTRIVKDDHFSGSWCRLFLNNGSDVLPLFPYSLSNGNLVIKLTPDANAVVEARLTKQ